MSVIKIRNLKTRNIFFFEIQIIQLKNTLMLNRYFVCVSVYKFSCLISLFIFGRENVKIKIILNNTITKNL